MVDRALVPSSLETIAVIQVVVKPGERDLAHTDCSAPDCGSRAQLVWRMQYVKELQPRCFKHGPSAAARKRSKLVWRRRPYCEIGDVWDLEE